MPRPTVVHKKSDSLAKMPSIARQWTISAIHVCLLLRKPGPAESCLVPPDDVPSV